MTTWYFDSVNGSDSNNGTSTSTPKQNYSPTGTAAGDTFLFKRGTTQTVTVDYLWPQIGVSDTQRSRFGAYGVAQVAYSIWKYGNTTHMILNAAQCSYTDFEDMYFDMRGTDCRQSVYCAAQSNVAQVGFTFRRCFFQGSNSPSLHTGSGLTIQQEDTATSYPTGYVIEDCEFFDNDTHGLMIIGGQNIQVRRSKFYRNGANDPNGGHGFSSRWNRTDATSAWTSVSGTIWKIALAANELDVYYVNTQIAPYYRVRRTAGTATAPGVGEYGVSAGFLYININSASNPSGQGVRYAWGRCGGLIIENNESYDNYWNQAAPYHEGHGFAFDDFTEDSKFLGNKSYNNQGAAFSINAGDRNIIRANVAYGNWQAAVVNNPSDGLNVLNNTFYSNNAGTGRHDAEIRFNGYCLNAVASNNILVPTVSYGIARETTDTGFSGTKNCIYGHTVAAEKISTVTGTVSTAPLLDADYRPQAASLKQAGANLGGKDYYGKQFYQTPNIGAVGDLSTVPRYGLRDY